MILFCGMYFFRIFAGKTIKLIKTLIPQHFDLTLFISS